MLIEHAGYTEKQVCKVQSREPPAVAPGELEGAGKWELEGEREPESGRAGERGREGAVEREEQPALMPPLGHYRRPASNRAGC